MYFLGINAFSHDSSAAIVDGDGVPVAAVEEERFTRRKRESRFPIESIRYCLAAAGIDSTELAGIAFGWSPYHFAFGRLLRSNLIDYPVGFANYRKSCARLHNMIGLRARFLREIGSLRDQCVVTAYRHHLCHASSAYFASSFEEAAYLTVDGRGERDATTWGIGQTVGLTQLGSCHFPHSLGKLHSSVSRYLGFHGADKSGAVMALAAHGQSSLISKFRELVFWDAAEGPGSFRLNSTYFDLKDIARPSALMQRLFGALPREENAALTDFHRDVAATLQLVTQELLVSFASSLRNITRLDQLVMAGGVALNTVANGIILDRAGYRDIFIQPAAHDAGLSLGAALLLSRRRQPNNPRWRMRSAALGPEYDDAHIESVLSGRSGLVVRKTRDPAHEAASRIAQGDVVGWFQGRLEFGPRALGQRCLLADPRSPKIKDRLNRIKGRESFRPFAIAILANYANTWLQRGTESPFMQLVDSIKEEYHRQIPGALHVDNSVRVQTVQAAALPLFHSLLGHFYRITKIPLLISTSLNIRGEPLACTPVDAIRVLMESDVDSLVIGGFVLTRQGE